MKWESSSRRSIDGDWIRENESNEHYVGSSYDDEYDSILDSINTDETSFLDDMEQTEEDIEKTPEELMAETDDIIENLKSSLSAISEDNRQKIAEDSFKDFVERAKSSELEKDKTKSDIQNMFSDTTSNYQQTKENSFKERKEDYGLQDMINDTDIQRKNDSIDIGRKL